MNDKRNDPYVRGLSPCLLSDQCVLLMDELEMCDSSRWIERASSTDIVEDPQLLERLCAHLPDCLTCTMAIMNARRERSQQRNILRAWLAEGEQQVPSTVSTIIAALSYEQ